VTRPTAKKSHSGKNLIKEVLSRTGDEDQCRPPEIGKEKIGGRTRSAAEEEATGERAGTQGGTAAGAGDHLLGNLLHQEKEREIPSEGGPTGDGVFHTFEAGAPKEVASSTSKRPLSEMTRRRRSVGGEGTNLEGDQEKLVRVRTKGQHLKGKSIERLADRLRGISIRGLSLLSTNFLLVGGTSLLERRVVVL